MQRNNTLPTEAREEGDAVVFFILREGAEVYHDEIGEGEKREWDGKRQKGVRRASLQSERNGWKDISHLHSQ